MLKMRKMEVWNLLSGGKRIRPFLAFFVLVWGAALGYAGERFVKPKNFKFVIVKRYPHDPKAFTEGLAWDKGVVYEGTGKRGHSSLRRVDLETGRVEKKRAYPNYIFAEGLTVFRDTIYQLTWKNKIVFLLNKNDFSLLKTRPSPRQGWGITHDGTSLIVSDGSSTLYFLDPETLFEKRRVTVHDGSRMVEKLNELEFVKGQIYANVWPTNRIVMINPETGAVEGWVDLSRLFTRMKPAGRINVLNGIMYDPAGDRLFVTGKLWPALFEIKILPSENGSRPWPGP